MNAIVDNKNRGLQCIIGIEYAVLTMLVMHGGKSGEKGENALNNLPSWEPQHSTSETIPHRQMQTLLFLLVAN